MKNVKEYIKENILLFDGAMGTYYTSKIHSMGSGAEYANLKNPEIIKGIHTEYLKAGAMAIKTNTFGVNRISMGFNEEDVLDIIKCGFDIATEAAKPYGAYVFADIGPMPATALDVVEEYKFVIDRFIECGAKNFLFETLSEKTGIAEITDYIKEKVPDAFVITSFAVDADGYSRDGVFVCKLISSMEKAKSVDAVGLNCVCGSYHMQNLLKDITCSKPLAVMPNAGYPVVVNNRTYFDGDPDYYAIQAREIIKRGASIIGGCCGTSPEHISKLNDLLKEKGYDKKNPDNAGNDAKNTSAGSLTGGKEKTDTTVSPFWEKLKNKQKVIAVELDSPAGVSCDNFMKGAWELKSAGADIITIADCPIARARMDSSILACKIRRELNMDAMPHMTCRDRNLNATKALVYGQYAEGIRNVLLITGDPIPTAERNEVKSVYQFNSRKLASYINSLVKMDFPGELHLFGALNINARNFDKQLEIAVDKERNGMVGFLTQPALTQQAIENLKIAKETLKGYILGGIMPIVSERNALFMENEVNGINVDKQIIELYHGKNRQESEELAIKISRQIMEEIKDFVDGYYIITPFNRTGLIKRIIDK